MEVRHLIRRPVVAVLGAIASPVLAELVSA